MKRTPYTHARTYYTNRGQDAQANLRASYGLNPKADNLRAGADIKINGRAYQVKSSRATACHTHDAENARTEYRDADAFIFIDIHTERAYILDFDEYIDMVKAFGEFTRESNGKNGGGNKIRFNRQYTKQSRWLEERVN